MKLMSVKAKNRYDVYPRHFVVSDFFRNLEVFLVIHKFLLISHLTPLSYTLSHTVVKYFTKMSQNLSEGNFSRVKIPSAFLRRANECADEARSVRRFVPD